MGKRRRGQKKGIDAMAQEKAILASSFIQRIRG
jgi:hypothetical protein